MVKLLLKKSYLHKNLKEVSFRDLWDSHGIFTTMRVIGKSPKIFLYKEHINNLIKSLSTYRLNQKKLKKDLIILIKNFLKKNISYDHLLRIACNKNLISISLRKRLKHNSKFYLQLFNYKRVDPYLKNLKYKKILEQLNKYDTTRNDVALYVNNYFEINYEKLSKADTIVLSPGPGSPKDYPMTSKIYKSFKGKKNYWNLSRVPTNITQ